MAGAGMAQPIGVYRTVSPARRYLCELYRLAARVPLASIQRRLHLSGIAAARGRALPRPSWTALHLKAFAIVSSWFTLLRTAYLSFPRARVYEHAVNVGAISLERSVLDG